jgi:hypothetical protein
MAAPVQAAFESKVELSIETFRQKYIVIAPPCPPERRLPSFDIYELFDSTISSLSFRCTAPPINAELLANSDCQSRNLFIPSIYKPPATAVATLLLK